MSWTCLEALPAGLTWLECPPSYAQASRKSRGHLLTQCLLPGSLTLLGRVFSTFWCTLALLSLPLHRAMGHGSSKQGEGAAKQQQQQQSGAGQEAAGAGEPAEATAPAGPEQLLETIIRRMPIAASTYTGPAGTLPDFRAVAPVARGTAEAGPPGGHDGRWDAASGSNGSAAGTDVPRLLSYDAIDAAAWSLLGGSSEGHSSHSHGNGGSGGACACCTRPPHLAPHNSPCMGRLSWWMRPSTLHGTAQSTASATKRCAPPGLQ